MLKDRLFDLLIPALPKNELSHFVGQLVHRPLPEPLARHSVELFAKYYQINMNEAEFPLDHYKTIGQLFTRKLKAGSRPLGQRSVLHPADAQITEAGVIHEQTLIQAKGKTYQVPEFLRSGHFSSAFDGGTYSTYYLCPTDYHRVHSAVDGEVIWSCHVPGSLWPVNSWSVQKIDRLFVQNERIVAVIRTAKGLVAQVMVAATNVGNMSVSFDPAISTRVRTGHRRAREHSYEPPFHLKRGDEFGIFHLGSTVIMLYEKGVLDVEIETLRGRHVKVGQSIE